LEIVHSALHEAQVWFPWLNAAGGGQLVTCAPNPKEAAHRDVDYKQERHNPNELDTYPEYL